MPRSPDGGGWLSMNPVTSTAPMSPTLGLVDEPHAFTQLSLLTSDEFERAAAERGFEFGPGVLATLHRDNVLVPFFGIRYDARALIRRARRRGDSVTDTDVERAMFQVNRSDRGLELEREVGDLFDPAVEPYRPWTRTQTFAGRRYPTRRYLYSPYQLIGIRWLRHATARGYPPPSRLRPLFLPWVVAKLAHVRNLAVLLSAIEASYRPAVVPRLVGFGLDERTWARFHAAFAVDELLERLGRAPAELVSEAEGLLSAAHLFDPLRDWQPLVDRVDHNYQAKLRGDALLAWEHRVAAEMLLLAYESLVRRELAEPLPKVPRRSWAPRSYRLSAERDDLDAVLMRYGLSPHPSVLVIAEGEIEDAVLRPLLAERLRSGWETSIRLHSRKGIDKDVSAIAEFVSPTVSGVDGDWLELARPPIRIVIAGDPERALASAAGRETLRQQWLDRLLAGMPQEWRGEHIRRQLDGLIEVFVWGEPPTNFEFAHFSDDELADGILEGSQSPDTPRRSDLVATIVGLRPQARNLKEVWAGWRAPVPTKMRVVSALAPRLLARVHREIDESEAEPQIPLARLVLRVIELAIRTPRQGSVVLSGRPEGEDQRE